MHVGFQLDHESIINRQRSGRVPTLVGAKNDQIPRAGRDKINFFFHPYAFITFFQRKEELDVSLEKTFGVIRVLGLKGLRQPKPYQRGGPVLEVEKKTRKIQWVIKLDGSIAPSVAKL